MEPFSTSTFKSSHLIVRHQDLHQHLFRPGPHVPSKRAKIESSKFVPKRSKSMQNRANKQAVPHVQLLAQSVTCTDGLGESESGGEARRGQPKKKKQTNKNNKKNRPRKKRMASWTRQRQQITEAGRRRQGSHGGGWSHRAELTARIWACALPGTSLIREGSIGICSYIQDDSS